MHSHYSIINKLYGKSISTLLQFQSLYMFSKIPSHTCTHMAHSNSTLHRPSRKFSKTQNFRDHAKRRLLPNIYLYRNTAVGPKYPARILSVARQRYDKCFMKFVFGKSNVCPGMSYAVCRYSPHRLEQTPTRGSRRGGDSKIREELFI